MVKSKKAASKKSKQDETSTDVEAPVEDSIAADGKTEDDSEATSQENGDEPSLKKKTKAKISKKEDAEESANEEDSSQQNGAEDAGTKKKPASKKVAKSDAEDSAKEEDSNQQNGAGDAKKKPAPKRAAKPAKSQAEPARKSSRTPKPVTKEGTEESYEVEKIVDCRLQRGKSQYLIHWKGYSKSEDTWEDEASLNCPELLQKYKEENKAKKRSSSKPPSKSAKKQKKEVEKDYEVEEIVGMRVKKGKKEFKIRWKGYKSSDDTWEPEKHLSCQDLISKYLEDHKDNIQDEDKKSVKKTPAKSSRNTKRSKAK